jgi:hypothetical protein
MKNIITQFCIIRGDNSGVFYGKVISVKNKLVEMEQVRKIRYWECAKTIVVIAVNGIKLSSQVTIIVDNMIINDSNTIIPCSETTISIFNQIPVWTQN